MATASGRHDDLRHEILREVANPQLYRANAFRVLGLSVTVDSAEMNRQQKKLKMLEKLGGADTQNQFGAMSLTPPPGAEDLRRAGQRLQDMQHRMIDELFWFWPADHANDVADAAYQAACQGRLRDAHDIWCQQKDHTGVWTPNTQAVAIHNLAVLYHALALDLEYTREREHERERQLCHALALDLSHTVTHGHDGSGSGELKTQARRNRYWVVALEHWAAFVDNESGWSRVLSRATSLDDPRLTSDFVRRLRHSLPEVILSINISLAVRAAKRGDGDEAKRHLLYVRKSGFDLNLADRVLEREASPLVEQVRRICEPIADRSEASPETANQLATSVLKECRVLLTGLSGLLRKEHYLRQDVFDLVASTVRGCMIAYGNATEDWSGWGHRSPL